MYQILYRQYLRTATTGAITNPIGLYVQGRYVYVVNEGSGALVIFDVLIQQHHH